MGTNGLPGLDSSEGWPGSQQFPPGPLGPGLKPRSLLSASPPTTSAPPGDVSFSPPAGSGSCPLFLPECPAFGPSGAGALGWESGHLVCHALCDRGQSPALRVRLDSGQPPDLFLAGSPPPLPPAPAAAARGQAGAGGRRRDASECALAASTTPPPPQRERWATPGPGPLPTPLPPAWQSQRSALGVPGRDTDALRSGPCLYGFGRENHILLFTLHCFLPDSSAWEFSWPAARDSGFDCRALSSPAPACSVSQRRCRALSGRAGPSEVPCPGPQVFHPQDGRGYPCLRAAWEDNGVLSPR